MTNLIMLEVANNNAGLNLLESDEVIVDVTKQPRGNGKELGVFKLDGEHFISKFTRFGKQFLFFQDNGPIRTIHSERVEIVGTVIEKSIEKAPAVTGANRVHAYA